MKKIIAVSIILLLAMSACNKEHSVAFEPNYEVWTTKVLNTSTHDVQLTVGDTTYNLLVYGSVSIPDSLWLWKRVPNGTLEASVEIKVDSVVISRDSMPPSVHRNHNTLK